MRLSSRFKQLSVTVAAIAISGCSANLPELPTELGPQAPLPDLPAEVSGTTQNATQGAPDAASLFLEEGDIEVLHKANYNPFDLDNGKNFRALKTFEIYRSELGRHSIEATKAVDFTTSQVLVSSSGEKPTGGYTVSVTKIEEIDGKIIVTVVQNIPGPGCITTQGVTHPFEFVTIPSLKSIEIFERQQIDQC